ncbi:NAD-dependent succinate-semialdehyde dehydrogenase [Aspergillus puulaauensis]|uniref:Aldehyde dehydrogenase domain-containing protein n=1 Tax=Aspergillus puulaauensis TaxID=1220207 RepID=A0A7R7XBR0_9EURO|nr:uncharacterized protein APUU_11207S [Aspergillus puulaauensis]BCS18379.1 hypothetical protein APUU_11207S [Aspergillus puulaauensis]
MAPSYPPLFQLEDLSLFKQDSFVNGEWVGSASGKRFAVLDPGSGKEFASCPINSSEDVNHAVEASHDAFQRYQLVTARDRAKALLRWHDLITAAKQDIATIVTYETGKPLAEALGELDYALGFTWWFAGEAERIQGTVGTSSVKNRRNFTIKQPIGVSVAMVPWNFPVAMILRKASAALAAGCSMVIKPSPETPLSVLALVELAARAGVERGALTVLTTDLECTPALSESLCKHPLVRKVTFTGSTRVGKLISRHCSDGLKKLTLELGGNCPFIVFDDANLTQAVEALALLKWRHAGQACITANRVYIQSGVYDQFKSLLTETTKKLKVGHGAAPDTTIGPLTTAAGVEKVEAQVQDAISKGGKVVLGGRRPEHLDPDAGGYFYSPTIISDATADMIVAHEETFGPLCALFRFDTEEQVVRKANETSMGLASYFFTRNVSRTWRLVESLEAGMIGMNTGNQSAAEAPFGGIKESGYGKESGKDIAVNEYLVTKSASLTLEPAESAVILG